MNDEMVESAGLVVSLPLPPPVLSIRDGSLFIVGARPLQTLFFFFSSSSSMILLLLSIRIFGLLSFF